MWQQFAPEATAVVEGQGARHDAAPGASSSGTVPYLAAQPLSEQPASEACAGSPP
jgi:hypothetical protein